MLSSEVIKVHFLFYDFLIVFPLQVGAFSVLKELVVVLPDCLAEHIGSLIPGFEKALCVSFIYSYVKQNSYYLDVVYKKLIWYFTGFLNFFKNLSG